jgi:hypothetical protein
MEGAMKKASFLTENIRSYTLMIPEEEHIQFKAICYLSSQ